MRGGSWKKLPGPWDTPRLKHFYMRNSSLRTYFIMGVGGEKGRGTSGVEYRSGVRQAQTRADTDVGQCQIQSAHEREMGCRKGTAAATLGININHKLKK